VLEARTLERVDRPLEADQAPGPDDRVVTLDLTRRARRAMSSLPPEQRAALELAYLGGKTSAEISDLEGIPIGTAKTRIRAALLRLRESMASDMAPEIVEDDPGQRETKRGEEADRDDL
jgi:RNA polymerase sigma-70 factor (ECF subfamily)